MKILHRYIFSQLLRNLLLSVAGFTFLFLVIDFFDRIDNLLAEDASFWVILQYFMLKIPLMITLMLPVAMLVATLLTFGLLSRNSEMTAMRASGLTVFWLARPMFVTALVLSGISFIFNETLVPFTQRRVQEIYNIDVRQKDRSGSYSKNDFWWRSGNDFYSVDTFDSRTSILHDLSKFEISSDFSILKRWNAKEVHWVDPTFGWSMHGISEYRFANANTPEIRKYKDDLPLTIKEKPEDFYKAETDPQTMSRRELSRFIEDQKRNGLSVTSYMADLYDKSAFPFIIFFLSLVVLPFALKPARSGSMALSFTAGLIIGFSYYAVHSFGISLGRAELLPAFFAAWTANILMGFIGLVLNLGAESPS